MQFTDNYRSLDRYDVCMIPGHVDVTQQATFGATAICGGLSGVSTFPLVTISGSPVGKLLVWLSINGYAYFSLVLDCASDGGLYGLQPTSTSTSISFGMWKTAQFANQYSNMLIYQTPYTCFTFPVNMAATCDPNNSAFSLNSFSCRSAPGGSRKVPLGRVSG